MKIAEGREQRDRPEHPESHEPTNPAVRITAEGRWIFETELALDSPGTNTFWPGAVQR